MLFNFSRALSNLHVSLCRSAKVKAAVVDVEITGQFKLPSNVFRHFGLGTFFQPVANGHLIYWKYSSKTLHIMFTAIKM